MDLSYNEQQRALKSTAREFFQTNCPMGLVREMEGASPGYSPDMWRKMAGLHWLGITYPERYGGSGQGFLELYVLYEEMGRVLAPTPHLSTVVLAGETILQAGSEEQKRRFLPPIARGELLVASAMLEPNGEYPPQGIELAAAPLGSGYQLTGAKLLVSYADVADYVLCVARTRRAPDPRSGITLFLVDRRTPGVSTEKLKNIGGLSLHAVNFDGAAVGRDALVGQVDQGWQPLAKVLARAAALRCAEIAGAGERVLEMATTYAKERVQFGRPIGSFQAVQYLCSDVAIDLVTASLLGKQAAWRIHEGLSHDREAAMAKAAASHAIQHLTRQAQEVLAGVAFMLEHDLQMYTRRAKAWELDLGDTRHHQEALAVAMGL